jgi:hypothetical protein
LAAAGGAWYRDVDLFDHHKLIDADAKRGIKTRLVYLDDAAVLKGFAVNDASDPRQSKEAIDSPRVTGSSTNTSASA